MRLGRKTQITAGLLGLTLLVGTTSGCGSKKASAEEGMAARIEAAATKAEAAANRAADAAAKAAAAADRADAAAQKAEAMFRGKMHK